MTNFYFYFFHALTYHYKVNVDRSPAVFPIKSPGETKTLRKKIRKEEGPQCLSEMAAGGRSLVVSRGLKRRSRGVTGTEGKRE